LSASKTRSAVPPRPRTSQAERPRSAATHTRLAPAGPPFELLESKLRPPRCRGTVPRGELLDLLEDPRAAPVVFVSAGPGWGKTTLLAQWAARSPRAFAWVGVDGSDNDPIVLLTYVAAALDRVSPLDPRVFEALASPGVSVEATVVPRLGAALAAMGRPTVLVLDDVHLVESRPCLDAIAMLTRHVPEGSQLALSARGAPALPLGTLRAQGLALEIGPDELRMDAVEAGRLLRAAGVELAGEQVAELTRLAEGWSAGLYLAALSMRARGRGSTDGLAFSGSDRSVVEYLRSELLTHLAPDELRFLLRTAVLERLSAPLCDAVLETSGSATILEALTRSNLFLVPLDGGGEWYRYHHLFQELLRAQLAETEPEAVPGLLGRAADWYEANGRPHAAIGYAQEAGDVDRVARLVELCGLPVYQSGRVATVERWLGWLESHDGAERNAAAAVLGALVATVQGRPAASDRWADAAERAGYEGSLLDGSKSIEAWLALLRAMRCRHGVATMRSDAESALRELAGGSSFRAAALLLLAISHWLEDEVDRADDLFADVVDVGMELGAAEAVAAALGERAALAIGREAWVEAAVHSERAIEQIRRTRIGEYPTTAFVCAVAARVALHEGRRKRAQELLARAQRLRQRLTHTLPPLSVQARLELARAYLSLADAGGARTMLREAEGLLRRRPELGTLPAQVEEVRASLATIHARSPGASTLTMAELRLIPFLSTHLSFREIGERLHVSPHTVKSQAMAVYRKLSVSSRSEAVERARELGLL
jgi:LuxR family maltose regulon positive regulatory protein